MRLGQKTIDECMSRLQEILHDETLLAKAIEDRKSLKGWSYNPEESLDEQLSKVMIDPSATDIENNVLRLGDYGRLGATLKDNLGFEGKEITRINVKEVKREEIKQINYIKEESKGSVFNLSETIKYDAAMFLVESELNESYEQNIIIPLNSRIDTLLDKQYKPLGDKEKEKLQSEIKNLQAECEKNRKKMNDFLQGKIYPAAKKEIKKTIENAPILKFDEYVIKKCHHSISLDAANEYADKGKEFIKNPEEFEDESPKAKAAYLQWHLVREAFANGQPMGKGMFTLECSNHDTRLTEIYKQLKKNGKGDNNSEIRNNFSWDNKASSLNLSTSKKLAYQLGGLLEHGLAFIKGLFGNKNANKGQAYSRSSTHYGRFMTEDGHFGIDKGDGEDDIPLPLNFKTTAFGMLNKNGKNVFYIKPETEGADFNRVIETLKHAWNLVKSKLGFKETVPGLPSRRENDLSLETLNEIKQEIKTKLQENEKLDQLDTLDEKLKKCKNIIDIQKVVEKKLGIKMELSGKLAEKISEEKKNGIGNEISFEMNQDGSLGYAKKGQSAIARQDNESTPKKVETIKNNVSMDLVRTMSTINQNNEKFSNNASKIAEVIGSGQDGLSDYYASAQQELSSQKKNDGGLSLTEEEEKKESQREVDKKITR